jgi:hypothetical protein
MVGCRCLLFLDKKEVCVWLVCLFGPSNDEKLDLRVNTDLAISSLLVAFFIGSAITYYYF